MVVLQVHGFILFLLGHDPFGRILSKKIGILVVHFRILLLRIACKVADICASSSSVTRNPSSSSVSSEEESESSSSLPPSFKSADLYFSSTFCLLD